MSRITIKDVASHASVSPTTVSHVVNKTRHVDAATAARVEHSINALGYHINTAARSLRSGRTHTIGLVLPDVSNPFFAEFARSIEDYGYVAGYSVIICNSDNDPEKQSRYLDVLISKQVDGIVYISSGGEKEAVFLSEKRQIPVVFADREIPSGLATSVLLNNEKSGYDATSYLIELGHKDIGIITGPGEVSPSTGRLKGYLRALREHGLKADPKFQAQGMFTLRSGAESFDRIFTKKHFPSALFVTNDIMAIGVIGAAQKHGLRVPQDLSIIGFDDIELAANYVPALTTMHQPVEQMSKHIMRQLIAQIDGQDTTGDEPSIFEAKLMVRETTKTYGVN